ncbi:MAG: DUF4445 domain-containing protein [Chloroflexi bacterium]|nr:DUF4445 domain-containing protein [Chloroflexota bacterium]
MGRRVACPPGRSLMDCARSQGIGVSSVCGGHGTCNSCKVQVVRGAVSPPTPVELKTFQQHELQAGWRLACQALPESDCKLHVPPESMTAAQRTQVEGLEVAVTPQPAVSAFSVDLAAPSSDDLRADSQRVVDALKEYHGVECRAVDVDVLRTLSDRLRSWDWKAQVFVRERELISVAGRPARLLGLAVDLGSTKIAGYLVDLLTGQTLAARGVTNPQVSYGEDVISRINQTLKSPTDGRRLRELVIEAINQLAAELCRQAAATVEEIADAVIVGNTAMHHLALGLPVGQLAQAPFVPAVSQALDIRARDAGLRLAAGTCVHFLPNIAGFVGADHVAMLLATQAGWATGNVLLLDIGTNTEVSLVRDGEIAAASCASGPAFEGGHIQDGMRAAAGAIERVRLDNGTVQYETIDGAPPVGICGSGILDAIAQMHLAGVLDDTGRMANRHPRVRSRDGRIEFVLVGENERPERRAIVLTQKDVRELQLAKAAIRAGIQMLLEASRLVEKELDRVIIAGAFGSYIDVASAITAGMLPPLLLDRFKQVGNAAGMGARMALVSRAEREKAARIASGVRYVELSGAAGFSRTFTAATYLGRYQLTGGKRKEAG